MSSNPSRHFILTNGRSGSNYFVQLLNQHPQIANYGEVLGEWVLPGKYLRPRFKDSASYLNWLYSSHTAFFAGQLISWRDRKAKNRKTHFRRRKNVRSIGVKEFTVNLKRFDLNQYLEADPEIRLITLVRNDPLARFVSSQLLEKTGTVSTVNGADIGKTESQLALNPDEIVSDLAVIEAENSAVFEMAYGHKGPVLNLTYEEYFASSASAQNQTLEKLQVFLGCEVQPLQSEHRKLRRRSLAQTITNYDEVRETLLPTRFAEWLDDASLEGRP